MPILPMAEDCAVVAAPAIVEAGFMIFKYRRILYWMYKKKIFIKI